jgi:hypothetical protein
MFLSAGFKHRRWEAFISVSASGPEFSPLLEKEGHLPRARMAADLRYTTADVDFLYTHFLEPDCDRPRENDLHIRLVNPSKDEVLSAFSQAGQWLETHRDDAGWDGGGIHFNYAGHGTEDQGTLVLNPGFLHVDEFIDSICGVASRVSSPRRLRVSVVLDSCHSGAWVTRILHACSHERSDLLIPFNLFAACMTDEYALEDASLGHGIFTYCLSVQEQALGSFGAIGILPDNSYGPALAIASGERGCSFLTAGLQNPVAYWNGAGQLEVSRSSFSIFHEDGQTLTEEQMLKQLLRNRDEVRNLVQAARSNSRRK